ncbi:MAG: histidine kinase [Streptosporangiaceae bacterium]|nr:histidine kinase [Streptosporangiaceae bacterium]
MLPPNGRNATAAHRSRWRRLRLRNWRVPVRLVALIAIPTTVAVLLGGLRVSAALDNTTVYTRAQQLATFGDKVGVLTHQLEAERDVTAVSVASRSRDSTDLRQRRTAVDVASRAVRAAAAGVDPAQSPIARAKVHDVLNRLDKLEALRHVSTRTRIPAAAVIDAYGQFIADLIGVTDLIAQGSSNAELAATTRTLGALARAKEDSSRERALLGVALQTGGFQGSGFADLEGARAQRDSELAAFRSSATPGQLQQYDDTVTGPQIDRAELTRARAVDLGDKSPDLSLRRLPRAEAARWFEDMTVRLDRMRTVEDSLVNSVIEQSGVLKDNAQRAAVIDGVLLLLVLAFVLGSTVIVARSLVRPLRRLRLGALEVAGDRLPDLVRRLNEPVTAGVSLEIEPIDVHTTDEIGEVARSFDEVHREAVRLASNEAMLRGNINAMFVNLSRRSQSLIERQLRLIDELEQGEQDDKRLASLFRLDHLATRMRRNCENLLVLGGQEQVRRWNEPIPLVDIVRASLSEVEQYDRIGVRVQSEIAITGPVVNDLIHLLAELVENATVFSPGHTKVAISGHMLSGGGAMLQVTDDGVGMTAEELEDANWRLANPPVLDPSVARRMGLFVVGRLAGRHGIRVELRAALSGGVTAFALLPARMVAVEDTHGTGRPAVRPDEPERPAEDPARSRTAPQHVPGGHTGPQPVISGHPAPEPESVPYDDEGFGWHTGPQPVIGTHTGPQPVLRGNTGPQPAAGWETGPEPLAREDTGPRPVAGGQTGPQPVIGQTGPQPVAPAGRDHPAAPPADALSGEDGPRPAEPSRRPGRTPQERSPIFDAMESEWFQRRTAPSSPEGVPQAWSSPADEGWQAAEIVRQPSSGGRTAAGLPKRVPGTNRVPGAVRAGADLRGKAPVGAQGPPPPQPQSADTIRNRFASLQQGAHLGRAHTQSEGSSRTGETP